MYASEIIKKKFSLYSCGIFNHFGGDPQKLHLILSPLSLVILFWCAWEETRWLNKRAEVWRWWQMERAYGRWRPRARMTPALTHGKRTVGAAGSVSIYSQLQSGLTGNNLANLMREIEDIWTRKLWWLTLLECQFYLAPKGMTNREMSSFHWGWFLQGL